MIAIGRAYTQTLLPSPPLCLTTAPPLLATLLAPWSRFLLNLSGVAEVDPLAICARGWYQCHIATMGTAATDENAKHHPRTIDHIGNV